MEPRKLTNEEIRNLVILELVSSDPYSEVEPILTEEERSAVHDRWKERKEDYSWGYILEPIKDHTTRSRFITLLQHLEHE